MPEIADNLLPALEHICSARRGCQLLPAVELLLAKLAFLVGDPQADQGPLERAGRLHPGDAEVLYGCGRLDLEVGRTERGLQSWRRCLELDPSRLSKIYPLARQAVPATTVANELLPDQPEILAEVAHLFLKESEPKANMALAQRLFKCAVNAGGGEPQQHYLRALAWLLTSAPEKAVSEYQEAVRLDPQQDTWHFELANLLKRQGRLSEAYQQALLCNQLRPDNAEYTTFLKGVYAPTP